MTAVPAPPPVLRAALWMSGAVAAFSSMAVAGRALSAQFDTFEIMMYRSFVGLVIVVVVAAATGGWRGITRRRPGLHLLRNVFHFTGQNLWFFAITMIPLAQVFALEFTSPLWVVVLAPQVLGERLTPMRALAALLGFVGILIVARPSPDSLSVGVLAAAGAAVGFALNIMLTKRLTRTETTTCVLFYMTLLQTLMGLLCAGIDGDVALPTVAILPWIGVVGAAGLAAHYCLTSALSIASATVVVPLDFARLPVIAIVGMALYDEALDLFVFAGAALIFAGNYLNIWWESRAYRSALRHRAG
ncbi:DMT family transporter [Sediminimonas qiaohouensis]|nr:DMT family transporter [Sediminimonas qiaohouensis]